jgi:hypothetical protein
VYRQLFNTASVCQLSAGQPTRSAQPSCAAPTVGDDDGGAIPDQLSRGTQGHRDSVSER